MRVPSSDAPGKSPPADRLITVAFSAGLGLLVVTAVLAIGATQRYSRDAAWVAHSHRVRAELQHVDAQLRGLGSDVRSFLLTRDSAYLRRYRARTDSAHLALDRLVALTADDPPQQNRIRMVDSLVGARLANVERTLELPPLVLRTDDERARGLLADSLPARLAMGDRLTLQIGRTIYEMDAAESALLDQRAAAESTSRWALILIVLSLGAVGTVLTLTMRRAINRALNRRAQVEAALRASEAKFAGILSIAADAIVSVNARYEIVHFNRGAEQVFGYSAAEVIGQPLGLLLPERLAAVHQHHMAGFADGPVVARRINDRRPIYGRRKSGDEFPAEASISKLVTPDGPLFTVVLRDVTEQQRLQRHEHVLAEAGRRLVATLDFEALLGVIVELPVRELGDWCVLDLLSDAAPAAEAGAGSRDTVGRPRTIRRIVSQQVAPDVAVALRAIEELGLPTDSPSPVIDVLRTGRPALMTRVGQEWLEAHAEPERLTLLRALDVRSVLFVPLVAAGRVLGVLSIGAGPKRRPLDGDDLALAEALADRATLALENARHYHEAQLATAARDSVLSVVSHDLRNPLSAVTMCVRTLLDHPPVSESERRRLCVTALDGTEWMHRLLQDLLDVASIEAGRLSIEPDVHTPSSLVESTLHMFAARAASQGITLRTTIADGTPRVHADGARIQQVLANLVSNALKYTPAGGAVTIGAAPRDGQVVFTVRDTGAGIAAEHLPHVFARFWHLRGASATRGTGLGLAIARGIVEAHGGRIWVESAVGEGSTFSFSVPTAAPSRPGPPVTLPDAAPLASESRGPLPRLGEARHTTIT